jgi:carboxypeptidase Q
MRTKLRGKLAPLGSIFVIAVSLAAYLARANGAANVAAQRLAGRAAGATPMLDDLRELCDTIGGRPTGSPACDRAVQWAAEKFRAAGVDSVSLESFTVPALWLGESAEGECLAPERFPIRLVAAPYSASTPGGTIEATLVDADEGSREAFAKLGTSARGAVALVASREMKTFDDLFEEYARDGPLLEAAQQAQVAAVLLQSTRPRGLLYRHPLTFGTPISLPVAVVSREHAARLARLLERGKVRVRLALHNQEGGAYEANNVVAEIRGRERPEEVVLLGAHLDSWDLGTGEEDNGVNAAMVIDVARGIKQLGLAPLRTIRFVLFTGEEQGMWGSAGYVRRHAAEMERHVAVVIFDTGSGRTTGFYLDGRGELRKPVNEALRTVTGLGASDQVIDALDGTDNFDFLLSGVPNLVANQDPIPYLPDYHAESDVYERVDARQAKANAAIASVLVWQLANSPDRLGKRQTRSEVEKLLKETKLDQQMKAAGQWDDWQSGRRGANP